MRISIFKSSSSFVLLLHSFGTRMFHLELRFCTSFSIKKQKTSLSQLFFGVDFFCQLRKVHLISFISSRKNFGNQSSRAEISSLLRLEKSFQPYTISKAAISFLPLYCFTENSSFEKPCCHYTCKQKLESMQIVKY